MGPRYWNSASASPCHGASSRADIAHSHRSPKARLRGLKQRAEGRELAAEIIGGDGRERLFCLSARDYFAVFCRIRRYMVSACRSGVMGDSPSGGLASAICTPNFLTLMALIGLSLPILYKASSACFVSALCGSVAFIILLKNKLP